MKIVLSCTNSKHFVTKESKKLQSNFGLKIYVPCGGMGCGNKNYGKQTATRDKMSLQNMLTHTYHFGSPRQPIKHPELSFLDHTVKGHEWQKDDNICFKNVEAKLFY